MAFLSAFHPCFVKVNGYIFKSLVVTRHHPSIGVGLYLAYSIMKSEFKGNIEFECKKGIGTKFILSIPLIREQ